MSHLALTYYPGETLVHRCDARLKIALLFAYSIFVCFVTSWWVMAAFALAVFALQGVAKIPVSVMNRMLVPVYVLIAITLLFNVVSSPTPEGLCRGLLLAVRMVLLMLASFVVCLTSASSELLEAFRWYLAPFKRVGLPVDDVSLTLSLALRFIPLVIAEYEMIRQAQRARGADLANSFMQRLKIAGSAFSAMFVNLFRSADTMADAMDARCYGFSDIRTKLPK